MKVYTTRWRIAEFIRNFVEERGYAPTIREIRNGLGISARSVVEYHLRKLEEEGFLTRTPEIARGIGVSTVGKSRVVPVLGTIAAGQPIPVPTEDTWSSIPEETVEVPLEMLPKRVRAYALRVKGDSMIDALVNDGDIVVMESISAAEDGEMVAAWLTDRQEATLKKLYREQKRVRLQPANERMDPIYVDPDKIEVQGRVIAVLRRVKRDT